MLSTENPGKSEAFWRAYLASLPEAAAVANRFYEAFRIGDTKRSADEGAGLILAGIKSATSSLLWHYEAEKKPLPQAGSLSIVEDGDGTPVCVVETTSIEIKSFAEVDSSFAYAYGEWDRTLATWRKQCWKYYEAECRQLGKEPSRDMPLVCERLKVIYPLTQKAGSS